MKKETLFIDSLVFIFHFCYNVYKKKVISLEKKITDFSVDEILDELEKYINADVEKIIELINKTYTNEINLPSDYSEKLHFFEELIFTDKDIQESTNKVLYDYTNGRRAIYLFKMKDDYKIARALDFYVKNGAPLNSPNRKNFPKDSILYLGKSAKGVGVRIRQHFSSTEASPSSLKLGHKNRSGLLGKIDLYIFLLKDKYHSTPGDINIHQNIILSTVESTLHDKLEPLVGSSRV